MHNTLIPSPAGASKIVIDWTDVAAGTVEPEMRVERLVSWIRTYPRASDIRVYVRRSGAVDLRLQRMLVSLGCTVTARMA